MNTKTLIVLGGVAVVAYMIYNKGKTAGQLQLRASKQAEQEANPDLAAIRKNLQAAKILAKSGRDVDAMTQFGQASVSYYSLSKADQAAIGPEMNETARAVGMLDIY